MSTSRDGYSHFYLTESSKSSLMVPSQELQTYFRRSTRDSTRSAPVLAFINDLPDMIKSSSSKLFADDSAVFKVIKNDHDRQLLQKDLTTLEKWEETWQMIIRIAPRCRKIIDTTYILHGHILEMVDVSI